MDAHQRIGGIHCLGVREEQAIDVALGGELLVALEVAGIGGEILSRPELERIHENAHDTRSARSRARSTRRKCPSCRNPMVGTSPMRRPRARSARDQARISLKLSISCTDDYSSFITVQSVR